MKKFIQGVSLILLLVILGIGSFYATYKIKLAIKLEEEPKEAIHKIYYAEDLNKSPVSLTYYTKKFDNSLSQEEQAKQLLNALLRGHENGYSPMSVYTKVNNVSYNKDKKEITVDFNEEFEVMQPKIKEMQKVSIDCIVNTLTQIKKVDNVKILIAGKAKSDFGMGIDLSKPLISNIKQYEISEMHEEEVAKHIKNLLYKDKEEDLEYTSKPTTWGAKVMTVKEVLETENEEEVIYSVVSKSKDKKIVLPKKYEQSYKAKKDGLYINDVKVLDRNAYAGNKWTVEQYIPLLNSNKKISTYPAELEVKEVSFIEEEGKIIKEYKVTCEIPTMKTKSKTKYTETMYFREGVGIYKKEVTDPNSYSFTNLEYEIK